MRVPLSSAAGEFLLISEVLFFEFLNDFFMVFDFRNGIIQPVNSVLVIAQFLVALSNAELVDSLILINGHFPQGSFVVWDSFFIARQIIQRVSSHPVHNAKFFAGVLYASVQCSESF